MKNVNGFYTNNVSYELFEQRYLSLLTIGKVLIWDTAGRERFRWITKSYHNLQSEITSIGWNYNWINTNY